MLGECSLKNRFRKFDLFYKTFEYIFKMNQASIFCRIASPENKNNSKMIKSNANELALKMKWLHNNTLQNTAYMSYQGFPSVLPLK